MVDENILLDWLAQLINSLILIFILISAINTECFGVFEWGITAIGLAFALFVKIISTLTKY